MKSAGYEKEHLNVHVNRTREARLEKLLGDVWKRAKDGDDGDPATLLRTEISKAKDDYRIKNGTAEQRKFGKALKEVQKTFASEGRIAQESLKTLLEHARRITNSKSLEENPANLFKKLSYRDADNYSPTVERSTAEQWNLLNPFLEAMSDQIDGVDTARQDLKYAIDNIKKSKNRREELRAPDLTEITHRHDVMAAIHDLARYVRSTLPDDPRLTAPDKFKAGVNEVLTKQKFTVETVENMQIFLKHADQMTLTRHSKVVRDAMREFYELSPLGAAAAEPSETIGAVAEQVVAVNPTAQSIGETDGLIFEGLLEHFTNFVNKLIDDEPRDIDNEVRRRIAHAPRSEILQIRDFFIRHAWMPAYFNKGETNVEKLFGAIAQNYSYYANQAVLKGAISEPEFWIERQEKKIDRFEKLLTRYGHEKNGYPDPSYGLQTYVDTLNTNLVELPEAFSPFYKYFADEENRVMDDLLIVKSETDYLEVLADFADIARSLAVDASPKAFRHEVDKALISTVNRNDIRPIVSKYPEFAYRHPTARAAREALYWSTDSGAVDEAQRKIDEIEIVAELLREHAGLNPYTGLVRGVPRRDRNNVMPHNVMPYETKIAEKNGDVRQALWELRREEKDKPPAAPRRRQRPPRAKQVEQKRPVKKQKAPPPMQEPPPLTPRSQAELESVIRDLEPPAEVGDAEI